MPKYLLNSKPRRKMVRVHFLDICHSYEKLHLVICCMAFILKYLIADVLANKLVSFDVSCKAAVCTNSFFELFYKSE